MQAVSSTFSGWVNGPYNKPQPGVLISWDKSTSSSVNYFTIGTSIIGGSDILKSAGGSPVFSDQYAYKDYTDYATGWTITKKLGQYPYGVIQSQADLTLNNATGIFTPASGSAIGQFAMTGRPVKLSIGFGGESIYQFVGYSDTPQFQASSRSVSMHCYDTIDYLNSFISTLGTQLNATADQIIASLLKEAGFAAAQYVLEPSLQPAIVAFAPQGQAIASLIQTLCEAEGGLFFCDEQGVLHFWNRQHFANTTTPVFTFNYSNVSDYLDQDTPILNYVTVNSTPYTVSADQQIYQTTTPVLVSGLGPSSSNNITNPSFEVSTAGWSGATRTSATAYSESNSASGINMTYDLSAALATSPDGIGLAAAAQMQVKPSAGVNVTAKFTGSPVAGQSVVGNPSVTVAGTGAWQNITISGAHYSVSAGGSVGSWNTTTNLPYSNDSFAAMTFSGRAYLVYSDIYYASLNQPSIGSFIYNQSISSGGFNLVFAYTAVIANSYIYVMGGVNSGQAAISTVYKARINANGTVGAVSTTSSMLNKRYYHSSVTYNGYVYALGGLFSGGQSSCEYAKVNSDGTLGTWTATTSLPKKLAYTAAVAQNGFVYVIGGSNRTDGTYVSTVYHATLNSDGTIGAWTTVSALPQARAAGSAVYSNGYIYFSGGYDLTLNPTSTVYYALVNLDGTLGSWQTGTSLPTTNSYQSMIADSGYVYSLGGYTGFQDINKIYYTSQQATGVTLTVSGTSPFYLDAVSTNTSLAYFDGHTPSTSLTTYSWNGTSELSSSTATSITPTYTFRISPANPVVSVDTPVANAGSGSAYTANTKADGTGSDMSPYIVPYSIEAGEQLNVSFTNTTGQQAYITSLTLFGTVATTSGNVSQSFIDSSSVLNYKLNPANGGAILQIDNNYIQTNDTAYGLAYYLGSNYATPRRSITTTNFVAPQLQFGDMVQFVNKETGETRNLFVVGKTDTLQIQNDKPSFTQQLTLQEFGTVKYFTIGTSTIGGSDSIAP